MQYLFLEPLQLTVSHLPTPPSYTSVPSKNSVRENSLTPSQSLSLSIDVCVRRKQSLTVFLSPSPNLHLSIYLSKYLSLSSYPMTLAQPIHTRMTF